MHKSLNIPIVKVNYVFRDLLEAEKLFTLIKETFTLMLLNPPINSSEHRICQVNTNICRKQK